MLTEEGKLSLEDDFTQYVPFDTKGRGITINQLLNHTSGIASYTEMKDFWNLSIEKHERDTLLRMVEKEEFLFEPGEALIYNNTGYFLLGLIIEKVSGKSYEEYLNEKIFSPLEMNNTYYCTNTGIVEGKVYGYDYTKEGLRQKGYLDHTWPYAAGSLCSTTEDLVKWLTALHHNEILSKELYTPMISPGVLKGGESLRYAMGLSNFQNMGHHQISHGGGINGFLSDSRYFPDEDLYIVCLVNTTGPKGGGFFAEELTWELLDKQEVESNDIDFDLSSIEGKYEGQVRGRELQIEIATTSEAILLKSANDKEADTLSVYVGNKTWMDGNSKIMFKDRRIHIDQISGYYKLERVESDSN